MEIPPDTARAPRAWEQPRVHHCERCGERMEESHCKVICPNCGFCRDCSDP